MSDTEENYEKVSNQQPREVSAVSKVTPMRQSAQAQYEPEIKDINQISFLNIAALPQQDTKKSAIPAELRNRDMLKKAAITFSGKSLEKKRFPAAISVSISKLNSKSDALILKAPPTPLTPPTPIFTTYISDDEVSGEELPPTTPATTAFWRRS